MTEQSTGRIVIKTCFGSVAALEDRCNELERGGHGDVLSVTSVDDGQNGFWVIVLRESTK